MVQSPLSLFQSNFLPIINSQSHLSTSDLGLCPWLLFNVRLEFAWCGISIFMIKREGSFSKWMSTKSCKFPCSTTGQGARTAMILINIYVYIHGQCLVHVNQRETSINITHLKQVLKTNKSHHHTWIPAAEMECLYHMGHLVGTPVLMGFFSQPHPVTVEPHSCNVSSNHHL